MTAINRLQDVYNLKAFDFTGGKYGIRTTSGSLLTAMDAFKFGRGAFVSEDMENTRQWMAESLRLLDLESSNQKEMPNRFSVLDHLAWSSYQVTLAIKDCIQRGKYKRQTRIHATRMHATRTPARNSNARNTSVGSSPRVRGCCILQERSNASC